MTERVSSAAPRQQDFGILLGLAYQYFVEALNAHLHERGFGDLGASFGYVFRALAAEPLTATELAERLQLTPQGAAKIVDDMVRRGYVERRVDPSDARARRLLLAPRGKRALRAARAFHRQFEADFARTAGAERAESLRATLERLIAWESHGSEFQGSAEKMAARPLRPL
jgi:DNA-binding MarR family transcriptional regulator